MHENLKPENLISRREALALTGWSSQHFARVMKDSGVTAIGRNYILADFLEFFKKRTETSRKAKTRGKSQFIEYNSDLVAAMLKATD